MENKKRPKISIAKIVQHANDIAVSCELDRLELQNAGLKWEDVLNLVKLSRECSEADSYYQIKKEKLVEATKSLKEFVRKCRKLRSKLREKINNTFKTISPEVKVPPLYQKKSRLEIAQDLLDLEMICRNNHDEFEKENFDFFLAEEAARVSRELYELIVKIELQRSSLNNKEKTVRDALYFQLYELTKKVRSFCHSYFSDDPCRRKLYLQVK